MLRKNCVGVLLAIILAGGCASSNSNVQARGNGLSKFKGQTFAGVFLASNGSREELFQAAGFLQKRLTEAGVSLCNGCPEIVDSYDLSQQEKATLKKLIGQVDLHPETTGATRGKPRPAWAIVSFNPDGTVVYWIFAGLTPEKFREKLRIHAELHWGQDEPVRQMLLP